jgi:hypothetical protein
VAQQPLPKQPPKPALGRGLEHLLGKPVAPESRQDSSEPSTTQAPPPSLSPGFSTLLRANQSPPKPSDSPSPVPSRPLLVLCLTSSLIAADALFIVLACWLTFVPKPTLTNWLLCGLALTLGAWLSMLAFWMGTKD